MLGGKGRGAGRPDLLPGTGAYGREREILGPFGLAGSEFPLDLAVFPSTVWIMGALMLASAFHSTQITPASPQIISVLLILFLIFGSISLIAWVRRKKLGRA